MISVSLAALTILVGQTHGIDDRVADEFAPVVDGDGNGDDAGKSQLAPLRQRPLTCADDDVTVPVEAPGRDLVDDLGRSRREADKSSVASLDDLLHALGPRELGMLAQMQGFTMGGNGDARTGPLIHLREFAPPRMARDMDQFVAVGR